MSHVTRSDGKPDKRPRCPICGKIKWLHTCGECKTRSCKEVDALVAELREELEAYKAVARGSRHVPHPMDN